MIVYIVLIIFIFVFVIFFFLVIFYNVLFLVFDKLNFYGCMWFVIVLFESGRSGEIYGFGIWGWCSWVDGVNGGDCVKKSFWWIFGDMGSDLVV